MECGVCTHFHAWPCEVPPRNQAYGRLNIEGVVCTWCGKQAKGMLHRTLSYQLQLTYCLNDHWKAKDNDAIREGIAAGCHCLFALLQSPFPR